MTVQPLRRRAQHDALPHALHARQRQADAVLQEHLRTRGEQPQYPHLQNPDDSPRKAGAIGSSPIAGSMFSQVRGLSPDLFRLLPRKLPQSCHGFGKSSRWRFHTLRAQKSPRPRISVARGHVFCDGGGHSFLGLPPRRPFLRFCPNLSALRIIFSDATRPCESSSEDMSSKSARLSR